MPQSHPIKIKDKLAYTLYKRAGTPAWQVRIKLKNGEWYRKSTNETKLEEAKHKANELYFKAQAKLEQNLPQTTRRFSSIAKATIKELESLKGTSSWKVVYDSYIGALNSSLIPYFGQQGIDNLREKYEGYFDWWEKQFGRKPAASTINTHNAILNIIFEKAKQHNWVNELNLPRLVNKGKKANRRPTFTYEEYQQMIALLRNWIKKAEKPKSKQMRELLYDYVLFLANTGIRPGRPSLDIKWKHIKWVKDAASGQKILRVAVTIRKGKAGDEKTRQVVCRHNCVEYLKRIQSRFPNLKKKSFDSLLKNNVDEYVFRLEDGTRTKNLDQTFKQFLKENDILYSSESDDTMRSLYSLRHFYATQALTGKEPIATYHLAMQMGTSEQMIYKHYSHLELDDIALHLAGPNYQKRLASKA